MITLSAKGLLQVQSRGRFVGQSSLYALVGLSLAACQPAAPPAPAPAPVAEPAPSETPFSNPGVFVWLEADGPGETALVHRAPDMTDVLVLGCRLEDNSFSASIPNAFSGDLVVPAPATLSLGAGGTFEGTATRAPGSAELTSPLDLAEMRLPVTAPLLEAIRKADSVRITVGENFAVADGTDAEQLARFADTCGIFAGLTSPAEGDAAIPLAGGPTP